MIFKSNAQFIFHDSRGFESGSEGETDTVKEFLKKRAETTELAQQLHAVWYCLSTDTDRPILAADETFFNECGMGKVPVIAIFTKFDALITKAFQEECKVVPNKRVAFKEAPAKAEKKLKTSFIDPLRKCKYAPVAFVHLKDMQKASSTCADLIEKTADAISDDTLKLLFLSVQQNNVDICVRWALRTIYRSQKYVS
ncbi:hypothetical protein HWV62_3765 [Athelia sp. TMB]|nr:hypothetical protein HWV62_3765 [Athelia sp. TMB]